MDSREPEHTMHRMLRERREAREGRGGRERREGKRWPGKQGGVVEGERGGGAH